ncbi:MAG: MBL fold metallo-hydrolase [Marinobacterium sp.]|nr:MBL fold metallo-hydrolase [Marinobacterium sp.]
MQIAPFFDETTFTFSYIVADMSSGMCAVIDPVLDFNYAASRTSTASADAMVEWIEQRPLTLQWILETHVHADHLSAASYLRQRLGGQIAIGAEITQVQHHFGEIFNVGECFQRDGSQFDCLLHDSDCLPLGNLSIEVLHTPGHTPACISYRIKDAVFVGDTLFMPDYGTARCDFPGGDAAALYDSVQRLLALPDQTRLFMCHDYKAPGRNEYAYETTVAAQKAGNIHLRDDVSRQAFVKMRRQRDARLSLPELILPSVQFNMRAGAMPEPEKNGQSYLKLPLNMF